MSMEILKNPVTIWFLVGLAMLLLEMAGTALVFLFFGVSAWIVAVFCLITPLTVNQEIFLFIIIATLTLVFLRSTLKNIFEGFVKNRQDLRQNPDEFIGRRVVVKESISPPKSGKVELNGTLWQAEADQPLETGTTVKIVNKNNLTLKVERV